MKLSLSGRLFESREGYRLNRDAFLAFAKEAGYEGVELRYPQMPLETPAGEVARVRQQLADLGLTWVFGTVEGIGDPRLYERSVATMKQHVAGGALFTRFTVAKPEQIPVAQRFADEAAAAGATLIMQLHSNTMTDNVDRALDTLRRLDRPNIKLAFDANHLLFDGDTRHVEAVERLFPHVATLSLQNYKHAPPAAPAEERITINGKDYVRATPGDPDAIDFPAILRKFCDLGFDGWATVMCDTPPGQDPQQLARQWHAYLKPLC